jgi:hypothetical protein
MKHSISQAIFDKYKSFMQDCEKGAIVNNHLCTLHRINKQAYLSVKKLGYADANGLWIWKKPLKNLDVEKVIFHIRMMQNRYKESQHENIVTALNKPKKPTQIPNVQTVIQPVQTKSHRKDISILWGLISIKIS